MTTILIFGDSIAYGAWDAQGGWVARLRKLVDKRNADPKDDFYCLVYNLGVSGDTTADVLQRMNAEINAREKDDLILVFSIGGNDAVYIPSKKSNKVAPAEFEKNINKIIKQAKKYTNHSLFTGIIPMDESKTHPVSWNKDCHYYNKTNKAYEEIIKKVCKDHNVEFVPLFDKIHYDGQDGVHPESTGHQCIFAEVKRTLTKRYLNN